MAQLLLSHLRYSNSLAVVAISIFSTILCEALCWLLIYHTNSYKSLKYAFNKSSKKLKGMKNPKNSGEITRKSRTRKIDRVATSLKESSRDLYLFKLKSGAIGILVLLINFGLLNNLFEGKPVAKLPFVPSQVVHRLSHRGLSGDDMTDCSVFFLYFLCSIAIRANLKKLLGFSLPGEAGHGKLFSMPFLKSI
ncbi:hypothetical protein ACH5RR_002587 [Cinchona calisaya]|uniref:Calcium load-activated calcium channel n=1 Tax=Cinchona calisaya TaxID=153742 RepID=A0ABD3ASS9_9GENT